LHLIREILGKATFRLKTGNENMCSLRQSLCFLLPFGAAGHFIDADECRDLELQAVIELSTVYIATLTHFLKPFRHQPRVIAHIVLEVILQVAKAIIAD